MTNSPQDAAGEWEWQPDGSLKFYRTTSRTDFYAVYAAEDTIPKLVRCLEAERTARIKAEGLARMADGWYKWLKDHKDTDRTGIDFFVMLGEALDQWERDFDALTTEPEGNQQEVTDAVG